MQSKLDKSWVGFLAGLISTLLGMFIFAAALAVYDDRSVWSIFEMVSDNPFLLIDKFLTGSVLFDVFIFAVFLRLGWYNFNKGILLCIMLLVPVIIYFNW